jgi:hypothetical protein
LATHKVHPLQTLHQAAQTNWRAAVKVIELDPSRAARGHASGASKRDVNKFIVTLVEAIERIPTIEWERTHLFEILNAAMPPSVRRCWEGPGEHRNLAKLIREYADRTRAAFWRRNSRRKDIIRQIGRHLPQGMSQLLWDNKDLIDVDQNQSRDSSNGTRLKLLEQAKERASCANADDSADDDSAQPE